MAQNKLSLLSIGAIGSIVGVITTQIVPVYGVILIAASAVAVLSDIALKDKAKAEEDKLTPFIQILDACGIRGRPLLSGAKARSIPWLVHSRSVDNEIQSTISQYSDHSITIQLRPKPGETIEDYEKAQAKLELALGKPVRISSETGIINMKVYRYPLPTRAKFKQRNLSWFRLPIVLGRTLEGQLIIDLEKTASPHLGIYGETNSGKSVIIRNILTHLCLTKHRSELHIHIIDLKGTEFGAFQRSDNVFSFSDSPEQAQLVISELVTITNERSELLKKAGAPSLKEYKGSLPLILLIVDELADVATNPMISKDLAYLTRKARAVGVHLILATQRPDKDVLSPAIKANVGNVAALRTTTVVNSQVLIDKAGCERLRGMGHGIYKNGSDFTEFQSEFISIESAKALIQGKTEHETD